MLSLCLNGGNAGTAGAAPFATARQYPSNGLGISSSTHLEIKLGSLIFRSTDMSFIGFDQTSSYND
jgi:hypothetical protein